MKDKILDALTSRIKKIRNFFSVIKTTLEIFPDSAFRYKF